MADRSISLANDLIVGCRTIKCYGWEQHYIDAIKVSRHKQYRNIYWINVLGALGTSIFRNWGLVAIMIISVIDWSKGNKLEMSNIVAILAVIFNLFNAMNFFTYLAFTTLFQFSAIVDRIGSIFEMEEYNCARDT